MHFIPNTTLPVISRPSLYQVIRGGGVPEAGHGRVTRWVSIIVIFRGVSSEIAGGSVKLRHVFISLLVVVYCEHTRLFAFFFQETSFGKLVLPEYKQIVIFTCLTHLESIDLPWTVSVISLVTTPAGFSTTQRKRAVSVTSALSINNEPLSFNMYLWSVAKKSISCKSFLHVTCKQVNTED